MAIAAPPATPAASGHGVGAARGGAGVKNGRWYECKTCGEMFSSPQSLGGHVHAHHLPSPARSGPPLNRSNGRARSAPVGAGSSLRVPASSANVSCSPPPGFARRKRPATEAASRGSGKRRCIRLFGVDIAVKAPEE
jgi:hypothetical protein